MPRYKLWFGVGGKRLRSLGTVFYNSDDEAVAAFEILDTKGDIAELWRPDRKRLLATKSADGVVLKAAATE
jgi:hypothetical protein